MGTLRLLLEQIEHKCRERLLLLGPIDTHPGYRVVRCQLSVEPDGNRRYAAIGS